MLTTDTILSQKKGDEHRKATNQPTLEEET